MAKYIQLPKFLDARGNLSFIEQENHIPFKIERTYWIYDVPGGEKRGGHAYKNNEELIVALSGSFDVIVDDGNEKKTFSLNRSYYGLYVPKGTWREMQNFSTNFFIFRQYFIKSLLFHSGRDSSTQSAPYPTLAFGVSVNPDSSFAPLLK